MGTSGRKQTNNQINAVPTAVMNKDVVDSRWDFLSIFIGTAGIRLVIDRDSLPQGREYNNRVVTGGRPWMRNACMR